MFKKTTILVSLIFAFGLVATCFAQTEDEIVAKYLQKVEKKQRQGKVGFISGHFSYGKLSDDIGYNQFTFSSSSDLASLDGGFMPRGGIFRSDEIGLQLGMMVSSKMAFKLGFDYWVPMETPADVDLNLTVGVLEYNDNYRAESKVDVYGFNAGIDYYLLNGPDSKGVINNLAVKFGVGAGIYMTSWNMWQGDNSDSEPIKSNAPGFWLAGGLEYPAPILGLVMAGDIRYFYLNFKELTSYNSQSGDLELAYTADGQELGLDFSGFRGTVELKRYFSW